MSGLGDVAEEARLLAQADGRETITFEDVERAIKEQLLPSDAAFEERLNSPAKNTRRQSRSAASAPLQAPCSLTAAPPSPADDCGESTPEMASEKFPKRDTQPAHFERSNANVRAVTGSHRLPHPALVAD